MANILQRFLKTLKRTITKAGEAKDSPLPGCESTKPTTAVSSYDVKIKSVKILNIKTKQNGK